MREILADLDRWQREGEEIAIATLVAVRRSAPRLPGARFAVTRSGRVAGSVSSGCVENDLFGRALAVLDAKGAALATYGISDEMGIEVGLSCGGSIDVLVEPFTAGEAWQVARRAIEGDRPAALAVGLAPDPLLGRKLAVLADGSSAGSIDAALDARVAAEARALLPSGETRLVALPWQGGEASVFVEAFAPAPRLFIVGATHTAIALCRIATGLGFHVTVIDPRSPYATRERFPEAAEVVRSWPQKALEAAALDAYAYVVSLSHDAKLDLPALALALRSGARYVGAIGSRKTNERRRAALAEAGLGEEEIARLRSPIGLDIGARTPEEVALSIAAEMIAVRSGREGGALRERRAPIHGR
jgi:xanthine dehydrogenase accessory factor